MKRALTIFNYKDNSINIYREIEYSVDVATFVTNLGYDVSECDYY